MSSDNATADVAARTPRRQRGRERVAGLMAAASDLFVAKGFDGTTMTEIAAQAGAAIGSLYLFFPTKAALAQAMATELASMLSARLEALRPTMAGCTAAEIVDALFLAFGAFLRDHPVYAILVELPGEESWRAAIRARRQGEIAALLTCANPPVPHDRSERMALILPQLMAVPLRMKGLSTGERSAIVEEMRAMVRGHLGGDVALQLTPKLATSLAQVDPAQDERRRSVGAKNEENGDQDQN